MGMNLVMGMNRGKKYGLVGDPEFAAPSVVALISCQAALILVSSARSARAIVNRSLRSLRAKQLKSCPNTNLLLSWRN
jgi:hypothetical protein